MIAWMPIRYISSIILVVAVLGIAFTGVDSVATDNSHQKMERQIDDIETAAVSLIENEEIPPDGLTGAQRHVRVELPEDSLTSEPVEYLELRRVEGNTSIAEYQFRNGKTNQIHMNVPIVSGESESIRLSGSGGSYDIVMTLKRDENGVRVVNATIDGN